MQSFQFLVSLRAPALKSQKAQTPKDSSAPSAPHSSPLLAYFHGRLSILLDSFLGASQDKNPPLSISHVTSRITGTKPATEVQEAHKEKTKSNIKSMKKDTLTLSQAGIEEAIGLSIAASEAMVITELVLLDSDASHFPVCNVLEAALRVKEARKHLFLDGEDGSDVSVEGDDDELGSLSDLDESSVAVACADVGFSDERAPDSNFQVHSLNSCCDSTLAPCSIKESTCSPQIFSLRYLSSKEENAAAIESEMQGLEVIGGIENLKEFEDNLEKDQEVAVQENTGTRKIIKKPFVQESSFISESTDTLGVFPFAPVEEPGNEIIASSTPTSAKSKCLNEGVFLSMDALCSIVPCSLSIPSMDQTSNEENNSLDLQENLSSSPNAQNGSGVVKRTMSCLKEYSVVIRDVQFNKVPQTFDKKHLDDSDVLLNEICEDINFKKNSCREVEVTVGTKNKRVRFLEAECVDKEAKKSERMKHNKEHFSSKSRRQKGAKYGLGCNSQIRKRKFSSFAGKNRIERKEMIFQGLDFLLTGLSNKKLRELQALIRRYGGCILTKLPDCPSYLRAKLVESTYCRPPVVICHEKVATTKFLYGCAIDSWVLNHQWLVDSVQAGRLLSPSKYLVRQLRASARSYLDKDIFSFKRHAYIFHGMGFLLYGKVGLSSKFSNVIKHGGGQVFQSLQSLVHSLTTQNTETGVILVENEATSSRHLKFCALEHNVHTLPVSWIIETLYAGKLAPVKRDRYPPFQRIEVSKLNVKDEAFDMSQEI